MIMSLGEDIYKKKEIRGPNIESCGTSYLCLIRRLFNYTSKVVVVRCIGLK